MKRPSLLSPLLMLVPAMLGARTVTSPRLDPAAILSAADSALAAIATVVHHARQTIVSVDGVPRLFEERVAAARRAATASASASGSISATASPTPGMARWAHASVRRRSG